MAFLILLILFEDAVNRYWDFSFLDEIAVIVLLGFVLFLCLRRKVRVTRHDRKIFWLCAGFYAMGTLSAAVFGYPYSLNHALISGLLSVKSFLAYLLMRIYYNDDRTGATLKKQIAILGKLSEVLLVATSVILLFDNFFTNYFTINEYRFGIHVSRFMFQHPTGLACFGSVLLLCSLYYRYSNGLKGSYFLNLLPAAIILSFAGRTKAIAFFALLCVTLLFESRSKRPLRLRNLLILIPIVIIVGWDQISYYFFSSTETARSAMYGASITVANDHFPLGAGFATFGTEYSRQYYSPLYFTYGLNRIWGLSPSFSAFIADAMWPAIIGETGYLGLLLIGAILYTLLKTVFDIDSNKRCKLMLLLTLAYLLIESIADTIFMSSRGVCIMLIFALFLSNEQRKKSQNPDGM